MRTHLALTLIAMGGLFAAAGPALAQETFLVAQSILADRKAVFGTVESSNVVAARARIGGTIVHLAVREGDHVERGQTLGAIGDEKIALQLGALDAQIAGLEASVAQAQIDLTLAEALFAGGTIPRIRLDEARTALTVANNAHRARRAERSVLAQQLAEGNVLAPTSGRVLKVPLTAGTVVLPGDAVATVAEQDFILRLRIPERHARFLKTGDLVGLATEPGANGDPLFGTIRLVHPQIEKGEVVADATVPGLGDYFVGQRVRAWISTGERAAFVVPAAFVITRFGNDYVQVQQGGGVIAVPVQLGREQPRPDRPDGVEVLSGLKAGDRLVRP